MQQQRTGTQSTGVTDEKGLKQEQLLECSRDQNKANVAEARTRTEASRRQAGRGERGQWDAWWAVQRMAWKGF